MKKGIIIAFSCVLVFAIGIIFLKYRPRKKNYNTQAFIMTNHLDDIDMEKIMEFNSFRIYVLDDCSSERYQELKNHHIEYFGIGEIYIHQTVSRGHCASYSEFSTWQTYIANYLRSFSRI